MNFEIPGPAAPEGLAAAAPLPGRCRPIIDCLIACLIAAVAIEHRVPVWHRNRDFAAIARYTTLEEFQRRYNRELDAP